MAIMPEEVEHLIILDCLGPGVGLAVSLALVVLMAIMPEEVEHLIILGCLGPGVGWPSCLISLGSTDGNNARRGGTPYNLRPPWPRFWLA